MLHKFSVSNYQSIREKVTLDFRVPRTTPEKPCFRSTIPQAGFRIPTVVVLVGPNGAGKTALLRALADTISFVSQSFGYTDGHIPGFPAFLAEGTLKSPTRVEVDFDAAWFSTNSNSQRRRFRYILELARDGESDYCPSRVESEMLLDFPKGRPRRLVARRGEQAAYVAKDLPLRSRDDRLSHIPDNASIFSTLDRMGIDIFSDIVADLKNVQMNVTAIDPIKPNEDIITQYYRDNSDVKDSISRELRRFDLGIEKMDVIQSPNGHWHLSFQHDGLSVPVAFTNESAGTRRIVNAFPNLNLALATGTLAIMDALDSELHTDLVTELLNWFRYQDTNPHNAQLICSLHNVSAFDFLEKEEIFVVEKHNHGVTHVFGLREVAGLRRGTDLQKQYLSGVLGGIPTFG